MSGQRHDLRAGENASEGIQVLQDSSKMIQYSENSSTNHARYESEEAFLFVQLFEGCSKS